MLLGRYGTPQTGRILNIDGVASDRIDWLAYDNQPVRQHRLGHIGGLPIKSRGASRCCWRDREALCRLGGLEILMEWLMTGSID